MSTSLIITAVDAEREAIGAIADALTVVGGIGRTNAAAATTEAILKHGPFSAVISAGVAGALPGSDLAIGEILLASSCIYMEEGLITPDGFSDVTGLGFPLGDFPGNAVSVDAHLLDIFHNALLGLAQAGRVYYRRAGPIATVATCSGTDAAAVEVARRTGALAEAMEGAAVVHAARRLSVPAIEIRAISNTTGDRAAQQWDLPHALGALGPAVRRAVKTLRTAAPAE